MADVFMCKNVFKNGTNTPTPGQMTRVWIKLINQLEQSNMAVTPDVQNRTIE